MVFGMPRFGGYFATVLDLCGEGRRLSPRSSTELDRRHRSGIALAGTIGGYVALSILVGLIGGLLLDKVLRTGPTFLIVGVLIGFITSFFLTYKLAMGELAD